MFKRDRSNQDGYNIIINMISSVKNIKELTEVIEKSIQLISKYQLDKYQEAELESYGHKKYNFLLSELRNLEYESKHNKKTV